MRNRPTPHLQRKLNKRGKPVPRYHVEIDDQFWLRSVPGWMDMFITERETHMERWANKISDFLTKRRPRGRAQLLVTASGMIKITRLMPASMITVHPLDTLGDGRVYMTEIEKEL